jgi:hypothetical protein
MASSVRGNSRSCRNFAEDRKAGCGSPTRDEDVSGSDTARAHSMAPGALRGPRVGWRMASIAGAPCGVAGSAAGSWASCGHTPPGLPALEPLSLRAQGFRLGRDHLSPDRPLQPSGLALRAGASCGSVEESHFATSFARRLTKRRQGGECSPGRFGCGWRKGPQPQSLHREPAPEGVWRAATARLEVDASGQLWNRRVYGFGSFEKAVRRVICQQTSVAGDDERRGGSAGCGQWPMLTQHRRFMVWRTGALERLRRTTGDGQLRAAPVTTDSRWPGRD